MTLPYDYYPAVLYAIDKISQGETKTRACAQANISYATFEGYIQRNVELQSMLVNATQRGHDAMAEALLHPDNNAVYGQPNPQMAKVVSDNIKWYLAKADTKRFGDKIEVRHEITLDRAITDAMDAARKRAVGYEIEHDEQAALPPPPPPPLRGDDVVDAEYVVIEHDDFLSDIL